MNFETQTGDTKMIETQINKIKVKGRWQPNTEASKIVARVIREKLTAKHKKTITGHLSRTPDGYDDELTAMYFGIATADLAGHYCRAVMTGSLKDSDIAQTDSFKQQFHQMAIGITICQMIIDGELQEL